MPTQTFSISVNGNDEGGYYADTAWPPNGGVWTDGAGSDTLYAEKTLTAGTYYSIISFMRFDTSTIPDDASVTAAILKLDVIGKIDSATYSLVGDYYDFGGAPTVAGDWIETSSPSIWSAVDLGSITAGIINNFTLTDFTGINKTGFTGIRTTLSSGTPANENFVTYAAIEHATLTAPQLEVTWASMAYDFSKFPKFKLRRTS